MSERLPLGPDAAISAALGELELNARKLRHVDLAEQRSHEIICLDDFDENLERVAINGRSFIEAQSVIESARAQLRRERRHLEEHLRAARMHALVDRLEAIRSGRAVFNRRPHAP